MRQRTSMALPTGPMQTINPVRPHPLYMQQCEGNDGSTESSGSSSNSSEKETKPVNHELQSSTGRALDESTAESATDVKAEGMQADCVRDMIEEEMQDSPYL